MKRVAFTICGRRKRPRSSPLAAPSEQEQRHDPPEEIAREFAAVAVAVVSVAAPAPLSAQQREAIRIGDADLGGVVSGAQGPEAGVWVIAETTDLPTKFAKIVVTDDQGRYVMPDLPKANYNVWVRGYGLVDSPKVQAAPGKMLDLTAVAAPSATAAAQYYPAIYWYSMLKVPGESCVFGAATRQEHAGQSHRASAMGQHHQVHRLPVLSRARNDRDPDHPQGAGRIPHLRGGLGAPHPVRAGFDPDDHRDRPARCAARVQTVRRLDRPDRGR